MKKIVKWLHTQRILVFAVLVMALLGIGATMALFTDTEAAVNTFTVGRHDLVVGEDPQGLKKNNVGITNTGNVPVYVRLQVNVPEGIKYIEDGQEKILNPISSPKIPDDSKWIYVEADDFWYYKTELQPTELSDIPQAILYESIGFENIPADQIAAIQDLLDITVYGESVQSTGFPDEIMKKIKESSNPAKEAFDYVSLLNTQNQ